MLSDLPVMPEKKVRTIGNAVPQNGKWGNRTLHETSPWFRGANPVVMCIFAGFAALGSGVPSTASIPGLEWHSVGVDSYLRCLNVGFV